MVVIIHEKAPILTAYLRLNKAREDYDAAKMNLDGGFYRAANDRAFFCMHHAARALLLPDGLNLSKPDAVIHNFHDRYIRQRYHDPRLTEMFKTAYMSRMEGVYNDYRIEHEDDALRNVENAGHFLETAKAILKRRLALESDWPVEKRSSSEVAE